MNSELSPGEKRERLRAMQAKMLSSDERERLERLLLANMRQQAPQLQELLEQVNSHGCYEDRMYRFYHHSYKVYRLQDETQSIAAALAGIAPEGRGFCDFFLTILQSGTGQEFQLEDNRHWIERTTPILQAFLHARYFLEMAVKYAAQLEQPPEIMPSGWAALRHLYDMGVTGIPLPRKIMLRWATGCFQWHWRADTAAGFLA